MNFIIIVMLNNNQDRICNFSGQFNPPSPMEIVYDDEDYPDVPVSNRNQTGWFWFGGVVGKNSDPKLATEEALDKLSSR